MQEYNISDLLPQRPPMQFITAIQSVDLENQTLIARVDITAQDLMYDSELGGVPSWISLEYMAQAIGCFIGTADRDENPDAKPVVGFIMGARKLSVNIPVYLVGQSYFIHVISVFCDKNIANFECYIYNQNDELVANGAVNVFRPNDIKQFMDENNE